MFEVHVYLSVIPVLLGITFQFCCLARFRNMSAGAKLPAEDATDTKTLVNLMSPRPESIGRRPGPGFG